MIPVIEELQNQSCNIILAGSGHSLELLNSEFPHLVSLRLPDYDLKFNRILPLGFNVALQGLKLSRKIREENYALDKIVSTHKIDALISDNRYGIYSKKIPSVIITHQLKLAPKTPFKFIANKRIARYLQNFDEIWVPDAPTSKLSKSLSNTAEFSSKKYIGFLSRFKPTETKRKNFILVTLSGPEPYRTQLENRIIRKFGDTSTEIILLRGKPKSKEKKVFPKNFTTYNHLPKPEFEELLNTCRLVISRGGYSTIMDLIVTQTPALLIPTPNQTEQEYLAEVLKSKFSMHIPTEKKISLSDLDKASVINIPFQDSLNIHLGNWIREL